MLLARSLSRTAGRRAVRSAPAAPAAAAKLAPRAAVACARVAAPARQASSAAAPAAAESVSGLGFRPRTVKKAERTANEDKNVISAITRPNAGPNAAEFLREHGRVPGVLYGKGGPRVLLHVERTELERRLRQHPNFFNRVFDIEVAGSAEPFRAIPVALTRHPGTDLAENVTFLHWKDHSSYKIRVPITYAGTDDCPGMRQGGLLLRQRRALPVTFRGTADQIPSEFSIDMVGKPGGHVTRVSDIALPDTCTCRLKLVDPLSVVTSTRQAD